MTSKRRKWLIALACAAVAIVLSVWPTRDRGPSYQGKTLDEWIEVYAKECIDPLRGLQTVPDHESTDAIRAMGTNALPRLLELTLYQAPTSGYRVATARLLSKLPFGSSTRAIRAWAVYQKQFAQARAASMAFGALGSNAIPAIPELARRINGTNSGQVVERAIYSLGQIGDAATTTLLAQLANTNVPLSTRTGVIRIFILCPQLGKNNASVVTQLVSCRDGNDPIIGSMATEALLRIAIAAQSLTNAPPQ